MYDVVARKTGLLAVFFSILVFGCQPETQETREAEETAIRLELLESEQTGIDFANLIDESANLNVFIWNFMYSGAGVAIGDISGDGLPDVYMAGNRIQDQLYLNKGDFQFENITQSAGIDGTGWSTGVTMADINADGLLDIYVCKNSPTAIEANNRNKLFINQGNNRFVEQATEYGLDDIGFSIQANFFDLEQDGDLDIFLVNQPFDEFARLVNPPAQVQAYTSTDRLFRNAGGRFTDISQEAGINNARYGLNPALSDYDMDGWTDVYICNDYHHSDHLYMNRAGNLSDELEERLNHISFYSMGSDVGDVNNDGWPDLFVLDMAFDNHYRAKTNMESMQPGAVLAAR